MTSFSRNTSFRRRIDDSVRRLATGTALAAACIVLFIVFFLVIEAIPALNHLGIQRFFKDESWYPSSGQFNMLPMVVGSLAVTLGATIIAAPIGIAAALFTEFYSPALLAGPFRRLIEVLSGIPSVVFGFWGLVVIVPLIKHSLLAGILILALMILPTVTLITSISLSGVPRDQLRGGAALGLTRWGIIWNIVLPSASRGIATAVILAAARAVGETMAVLMVCGNVVQMPESLLDPVRTLTANIALEMSYATADHRSVLFVSGLLLMAFVGILILAASFFGKRRPAS